MTYLPAKALARLSFCNQILKQVSDDDSLWQALIEKDFNRDQLKRAKGSNLRVFYGELVTGMGVDEELYTYRRGYDYLISDEHFKAWKHIHHFFLIPFKVRSKNVVLDLF